MKITFNKIFLTILFSCFLYMICNIVKIEIVTNIYGYEFMDFEVIYKAEDFKILSYTKEYAKIYCISKNKNNGTIHSYIKSGDSWRYNKWEDGGWSKHGTADKIVWPYWWHFFYHAFQ